MDKILRNTNIWDLHIHTPLGTPTKKNYENASTEEFIDTIIDIYNKSNNKIGMISFTDHNKINADVGTGDLFHELFEVEDRNVREFYGIESYSAVCRQRLFTLYEKIKKYCLL